MKCAIELLFDDESQEKLKDLRKFLEEIGIHNEAVPTNHISIADVEIENIDVLKNVVNII